MATPTVNNPATFQQPYPHAMLDGRGVRLIALGDQEGKSPVFLCVDEDGHTKWESQSKFVITDPNIQPTQRTLQAR